MPPLPSTSRPDVLVVGDGLIGLACAAALAERGVRTAVVGAAHAGQASWASAGMLAPGVERASGLAHDFALRSRDRYPSYMAWLAERTGMAVPLDRRGVLQLAPDDAHAERLRHGLPRDARWLERGELAALEPALAPAAGAVHYGGDGAVDNRRLLEALRALVFDVQRVPRLEGPATAIALDWQHARLTGAADETWEAERVVLAAGAWVSGLAGLPRELPVAPVRGQMLLLDAAPLAHVVYGGGGYAVPRGGTTLVGSTMERAGFDARTTDEGMAAVRAIGGRIAPALAAAPARDGWAGIRPITPDGLPIIGPDPEEPALVYACGHSRNGVLLAPGTADAVAALVTGERPGNDLRPFAVERFGAPAA